MWSLPRGYAGRVATDEIIFQTIDFIELIKRRMKCSNIIQAAVEYFKTGIVRLTKVIREKSVIIELNFKILSIDNKAAAEEISAMNPSSISWSNISDYFNPKEFHSLAKQCSGNKTLHFAYSMNWPQRVDGTSIVDYEYKTREGSDFYDWLIETTSNGIEKLYDELISKSVLHFPPVGDCRNLGHNTLLAWLQDYWVEYFFSKDLAGIESREKQVKTEKAFFNMFARTNSTIFYVFSYDSTCSLE